MAETTVEKATCENCGADVREGTSFCYNCGTPVAEIETAETSANGTAPEVSTEAQAALDDLADRLKVPEVTDEDKLAQAAAERRRARVRARRNEVVWEPAEGSGTLFVAVTLFISVATLVVVLLAVYWK